MTHLLIPTLEELMSNPGVPFWVRQVVWLVQDKDPVDVALGLGVLARVYGKRANDRLPRNGRDGCMSSVFCEQHPNYRGEVPCPEHLAPSEGVPQHAIGRNRKAFSCEAADESAARIKALEDELRTANEKADINYQIYLAEKKAFNTLLARITELEGRALQENRTKSCDE